MTKNSDKVYKYRGAYDPSNTNDDQRTIFNRDLKCIKNNQLYASHYKDLNDLAEGFLNDVMLKEDLDKFDTAMIEHMLDGKSSSLPNEIFESLKGNRATPYPLKGKERKSLKSLIKKYGDKEGFRRFSINYIGYDSIDKWEALKKSRVDNISTILDRFGILSLSSDPFITIMWAHYACNNTGYVLEYDKEILANSIDKNLESWIDEITYSDEPPSLKLEEVIMDQVDINKSVQKIKNILKKCFFYKNLCWSYERELRIIVSKIGLFSYDQNALTGIYFGPKMNDVLKEKMQEELSGRNIRFYNMKQQENKYNIFYSDKIK